MNPRTSLNLEFLQSILALDLFGKCLKETWEQVCEWESENERCERGEGCSWVALVFIEEKTDTRGTTSADKSRWRRQSARGARPGAATPLVRPHLGWARCCSPLAGSSQQLIQCRDRWDFGQTRNGLLDFDFPTKFYWIFNFYNFYKNDN